MFLFATPVLAAPQATAAENDRLRFNRDIRPIFAEHCVACHGGVQLFDWGWDSHGASAVEALNKGFRDKCRDIDQATAALLTDLEQRGLLDDTLVIWGGEFGRTPMRENRGGKEMPFIGRDYHPDAFTIWLAGGGVTQGFSYGQTDPIGYSPIADPVHVRDFHATLLHLLGLDHAQLTYSFRGLDEKLTGVKPARVLHEIIG